MWTSASGIFYKRDFWKLSLIDKIVGQQYSDNADTPFYKLGAFSNMDAKASVSYSNLEFGLGIFNLLNSRSLASVGITRVSVGNFCTHTEKERFFSYRRDKDMRRMAAAIWLQSSPP